MKLKKKIAMAIAMATICSSIAVPVKAEASCDHLWIHVETTIKDVETHRHGHLVGDLLDNNYVDCIVTIKEISYYFECSYCPQIRVDTERIDIHSVN